MSRIGIITLNGYFNYGNRLQNYALQRTLEKMGYKVDTIINDTKKVQKKSQIEKRTVLDKVKSAAKLPFAELVEKVERRVTNRLFRERQRIRTDIFKEFTKKYINETDFSITENNIPKSLVDSYDYFIVGSDQVWNPHYQKGSSVEFLTFAPKHKRISYAASFGISSIPDEYKEKYATWLAEMNHISVREHAGANIVKELTGRNVEVVVDPTLLLTKEEWLEISEPASDKPMKGYILTYFLGKIPKERKKYIDKIAKENDLEVINLAQMNEKIPFLSGPSEFIDYINSAQLFFTDSFHGAAFSIMLNTPFIVFDRAGSSMSMNSRIDTLLNTFNMETRYFNNFTNDAELFDMSFKKVEGILNDEREKAIHYLKRALQ